MSLSHYLPLPEWSVESNVGSNEVQFVSSGSLAADRMVMKLIPDWHQWYKILWLEVPLSKKTPPEFVGFLGVWFQIFFIFTSIWGRFPF